MHISFQLCSLLGVDRLLFGYGYHNCLFIGSATNAHLLPIVFIIGCNVVIEMWRRNPISFEHVLLWSLFFDPHLTTL
jgi:hypothetical protein